MLCKNCLKLYFKPAISRFCPRCKGAIINNIAVICDLCSEQEKFCAVCLKNLRFQNKQLNLTAKAGCSSCSKKK